MSHADGKSGRDPAKTKVARIKHMQNKNVDLSKLTNGRSYKEVLMDKLTPGLGRFHHPKSVGGSNKPANATDRAFEDESCWIDACSPNGQIDAVPSVSIDEGDSCRLEDYAPNNHYPAAEALPKSVENDNVSSFNDAAQTRVSMEANYKEPSFHGQQRNSVDNINNLIEIPVRSVSETSKNSMGSSAATAPVLDSKTGLFTIKPKCIKNPRAWNDYLLRSKLERMQSSASNRQTPKKQNLGKKKVLEHGSSPINVFTIGKASPKFPPSKHSNRSSEARMTLEESKLQVVDERSRKSLCGRNSILNILYSPSAGAAGGLITIWDPNFFHVEASTIEPGYISILGTISLFNLKCLLINIYAPNDNGRRQEYFSSISSLIMQAKVPVLLGGDFNTVRGLEEKKGVSVQRGAMAAFSSDQESGGGPLQEYLQLQSDYPHR
ncbi:hypothetical protein V6N13_079633 [Hibiscus sabdariffa]